MQVELVMTGPILRLVFPQGPVVRSTFAVRADYPIGTDLQLMIRTLVSYNCIGHKEPGYEVALATGIKMAVTTEMRRDW